jgi:transglutaminase-like putative cysteine protease
MSEDLELFLEPAPGIQCDHPEVMELARKIVKGSANDGVAASELFSWVRDTVRYSPYVPFDDLNDYLALSTLERGKGYCVQKSALLCALARAVGIPARLGFADIENHQLPDGLSEVLGSSIMTYHCFVEWFVNGRWLKSTPSFEEPLCAQRGWRLVEFDPENDSLLHTTDQAGKTHITYVSNLGWRQGVPLDEIMEGWKREYTPERVAVWADNVRNDKSWRLTGEKSS